MSYYYKLFWILTTITTFLRLSVIGKLGLTVDEAHYWVYSKFLDLSYYDHPPMIGYIIKLFTDVFGINEFAVRLPSVIIFVITSWLFFLCIKKIFNERKYIAGIFFFRGSCYNSGFSVVFVLDIIFLSFYKHYRNERKKILVYVRYYCRFGFLVQIYCSNDISLYYFIFNLFQRKQILVCKKRIVFFDDNIFYNIFAGYYLEYTE